MDVDADAIWKVQILDPFQGAVKVKRAVSRWALVELRGLTWLEVDGLKSILFLQPFIPRACGDYPLGFQLLKSTIHNLRFFSVQFFLQDRKRERKTWKKNI